MPTDVKTATCKYCHQPIVCEPYYRCVTTEPNPPVWFHPPGAFTCSLPSWPARERWPIAEPA